jgi:hypothetical protein
MASIGMPELIMLAVIIVGLPGFLFYRLGYNSGYRKALEKSVDQRNKISN